MVHGLLLGLKTLAISSDQPLIHETLAQARHWKGEDGAINLFGSIAASDVFVSGMFLHCTNYFSAPKLSSRFLLL